MKNIKALLIGLVVCLSTTAIGGSITYAKERPSEDIIIKHVEPKFSSDGPNDSHQLFAKQALNIIRNDKGSDVLKPIENNISVMLEHCDKPDKDEADNFFAYHFYNPYTKKNYLPSFLNASNITGLDKFKEHMKKAVNYYKKDKNKSMEELGRAIHFLEDINVPHHAANLIAGLSTHSEYEKYISKNNSKFFVQTSSLYDEYKDKNFETYYASIFNDCAKNAYSYKDKANSKNKEDWNKAAVPTIKMGQETIASLIYRFLIEVR